MRCEREKNREELAKKICLLTSGELLKYGLTRPGDVTGLDIIGIPVYTIPRPPGTSITVSSGKGLSKFQAKAGAILEAVELWASENPNDVPYYLAEVAQSRQLFSRVLDQNLFALAKDAPVNDYTGICFEEMDDLLNGGVICVPSDLIWMKQRIKTPFLYFQSSSNGLAAGYSRRDAELSAFYETIERDSWSLADFIERNAGIASPRVSLGGNIPQSIRYVCDKMENAGVIPFVFDITTDLGVPTFSCTILDTGQDSPGAFSGFGTHLDSETAVRRAMTEAAQSRCSYISGARDDMLRRRFLLMKNMDQEKTLAVFNTINCEKSFSDLELRVFGTLEDEWNELILRVNSHVSALYSKVLYHCQPAEDIPEFFIVRAVTPELETPPFDHWQAGRRAMRYLREFA